MTEKLNDTITNLIIKTNTFSKVETIMKGVSIFMFITGIATLYNSYKLHKITKYIKNMETKINKKLDRIIKTTENYNQTQILTPTHIIENTNLMNNSANESNETNTNNNDNDDNYDFLNECYDNMPCNNSKKATGGHLLFGWN